MVLKRLYQACLWMIVLFVVLTFGGESFGARIKDIAYFAGDRPNALIGYGLVAGLNKTGDKDKTEFTVRTLANLLDNLGVNVDPKDVEVKNVAAVMVTAKIPAFARIGSRLDVQVSSLGDAKSLAGGTLLMTPLQGPDGEVYALAQGPVTIGGFATGGAAARIQQNHPTTGYIANGAMVEKEIPLDYKGHDSLDLIVKNPDFTTAHNVSKAINVALGEGTAIPRDAGTVTVRIPPKWGSDLVGFISKVEALEIIPDAVAKVVINERTGTIVMGENVRIAPVAVAHGDLTVSITEQPYVSQPLPFAPGQTVVVPQTQVQVEEEKTHLTIIGGGVTIGQVIEGLNAIGATPRDLINILQAIKAAGALHAELEIM